MVKILKFLGDTLQGGGELWWSKFFMGGSGLGKETNHGNYFSSEISEKKIILTAELSRAVVLKLSHLGGSFKLRSTGPSLSFRVRRCEMGYEFLTHSQVLWQLLLWKPHFENHCFWLFTSVFQFVLLMMVWVAEDRSWVDRPKHSIFTGLLRPFLHHLPGLMVFKS